MTNFVTFEMAEKICIVTLSVIYLGIVALMATKNMVAWTMCANTSPAVAATMSETTTRTRISK